MSPRGLNTAIGVLLGMADLVILRIRNPRAASLRETLKRLVKDSNAVHVFDEEQFAIVLLGRYKEVSDRLADM